MIHLTFCTLLGFAVAPAQSGAGSELPAVVRQAFKVFHPYSEKERRETGMLIEVAARPVGAPAVRLAAKYPGEELMAVLQKAADAIRSGRRERYAPLLDWSTEEGLSLFWALERHDWSGVNAPILQFLTPLPRSTFAVFADAEGPEMASLQIRWVEGELKSVFDGNADIYSFLFSAIHGTEQAGRPLRPVPVPEGAIALTPKIGPTKEIPGFSAEERGAPRLILPGHRLATILPPPGDRTIDAADDLPEALTEALAFYSETLRTAAEGDLDGFVQMLDDQSRQRFRKKMDRLPNAETRQAVFAKLGRPREVIYAVPGPEVTILFTRSLDEEGVPTSEDGLGVTYILRTEAGYRLTDLYVSTSLERLLNVDDGAMTKSLMRQILDSP